MSATDTATPFQQVRPDAVARPPSPAQRGLDRAFFLLCRGFAWMCAALVTYIVLSIGSKALPAVRERGVDFLTGTSWDPSAGTYAVLPEIWGTLYSSALALILGSVLGLSAAIFLAEGFLGLAVYGALSAFGMQHRPLWRRLPDAADRTLRNLVELLAAIPSVVYAPRLASSVRFCAKVLTGFPSILAGVFAYGAVVLLVGGFSAVAGSVALSILMLPTVILTSEDAIRMVPSKVREASAGMGATSSQTVWMVLLPAASPGILTGIMLAVARAAGETAPLLFTALFSNYWLTQAGDLELMGPTASLAVLVYNFAGVPFENQVSLAWAAALVLVLIILVVNLTGQAIALRNRS